MAFERKSSQNDRYVEIKILLWRYAARRYNNSQAFDMIKQYRKGLFFKRLIIGMRLKQVVFCAILDNFKVELILLNW